MLTISKSHSNINDNQSNGFTASPWHHPQMGLRDSETPNLQTCAGGIQTIKWEVFIINGLV